MTMFGLTNLPTDNPLNRVYRVASALLGGSVLTFGVLGYADLLGYFSTSGGNVLGLSTNALLSTISVVVGGLLLAGAVAGGNRAAELNFVLGVLFIGSGLVNLVVLQTSWNVFDFQMRNVIFSFVAGLLLLTFGLYGRVSGGLPADNPYYRARHGRDPATGEVVDEEKAARFAVGTGSGTPGRRESDTGLDQRRLE
ncbi:MAG TPA: DUF4383 domain-containing protein [Mycobacteriales bacterium]|nr:DUF4383 domain-containing protein [Mycobacteriales bacterium]